MNKSIMPPEFMSDALRGHKQTKFSRGAYSAPQTPRCSYGSLRSPIGPHQKITHSLATRSAYGPELHHKALSHYNVLDEVGLKALSHYNVLEKVRLTFMKSGRTQTNVGRRLRSQEVRSLQVVGGRRG